MIFNEDEIEVLEGISLRKCVEVAGYTKDAEMAPQTRTLMIEMLVKQVGLCKNFVSIGKNNLEGLDAFIEEFDRFVEPPPAHIIELYNSRLNEDTMEEELFIIYAMERFQSDIGMIRCASEYAASWERFQKAIDECHWENLDLFFPRDLYKNGSASEFNLSSALTKLHNILLRLKTGKSLDFVDLTYGFRICEIALAAEDDDMLSQPLFQKFRECAESEFGPLILARNILNSRNPEMNLSKISPDRNSRGKSNGT